MGPRGRADAEARTQGSHEEGAVESEPSSEVSHSPGAVSDKPDDVSRLVRAAWVVTGVGTAVASPVWLFLFAVAAQGINLMMMGSSGPSPLAVAVLVLAFAATLAPAIVASRYARERPTVARGAAVLACVVHLGIGGQCAILYLSFFAMLAR